MHRIIGASKIPSILFMLFLDIGAVKAYTFVF